VRANYAQRHAADETMSLHNNEPPAEGPRPSFIVLSEWQAYPRAVRKYEHEVEAGKSEHPRRSKLLRVAKTLFDSSKDIFADSSYGKGIVSALAEGAEIFA
jgi:hypothetical protein